MTVQQFPTPERIDGLVFAFDRNDEALFALPALVAHVGDRPAEWLVLPADEHKGPLGQRGYIGVAIRSDATLRGVAGLVVMVRRFRENPVFTPKFIDAVHAEVHRRRALDDEQRGRP